jgi:hypothetical protein
MTTTADPQTARDAAGIPPAAPGPKPSDPAAKAVAVADPRYLALRNFAISISVFNILGYTVLGFEQPWLWPIISVVFAYFVEMGLEVIDAWVRREKPAFLGGGPRGVYEFLLPAHITALAVNMLLYANTSLLPVLLGVVVGVGGKHVVKAPIKGKMKHFMNPSNFGIVVVLLFFGSWVSIAPPYEFVEKANDLYRFLVPMLILTAGTVINAMLTKKIPLIVGWVGGFVIQALVRWEFWHVALYSALGPITGVAFVLFTNYMITDPGTTPFKPRDQFIFGAGVATVYGVLLYFNIVYTLFFATAITCLIRGVGWWVAYFYQQRKERANAPAEETTADESAPVAVTAG